LHPASAFTTKNGLYGRTCKKSWMNLNVIPAKAGHVGLRVKSIFSDNEKNMISLLQGDDDFLQ
jgi:hypothetical protein